MRIPGNVYNSQIATHTDRANQAKRADGDDAKAGSTGKTSNVSDITVAVSSRAKELAADSALDMAKVDRLRAAMANGTFGINVDAIAARLVETGG